MSIVAFWLATTGWLVSRDLWPHVQFDEPPPFAIDLVDEAQRQAVPVQWTISHNGKTIGRAHTTVVYREADDTFALRSESRLELPLGLLGSVKVQKVRTTFRVTRAGELRELAGEMQAVVRLRFGLADTEVKGALDGEVRGRRFLARGWVQAGSLDRQDFTLDPVPVSADGVVLNPLHPVNRLLGLRPGQRWRMPAVNPLTEALARSAAGMLPAGPRFLDAEVLAAPQVLTWGGQEISCLVIEYRDDQRAVAARTWVRQTDGLVLRQEAVQGGETLVLQRE